MAEKVCECIDEWKARRKQRNGKKRHYTIKDLNRISLYVNRDEKIEPLFIIAELSYFHGYGTLFCKSVRTIEKLNSVLFMIQSALYPIAISGFIGALVAWLRGLPLLNKIALLKGLAAVLILLTTLAKKTVDIVTRILADDGINTAIAINKAACSYLRTKYGAGVDEALDDEYSFDMSNEIAEVMLNAMNPLSDFELSDIFPTGDMKP